VELFEQMRREYEFGVGTIAGVASLARRSRNSVTPDCASIQSCPSDISADEKKKPGHGRNGADAYRGATRVEVLYRRLTAGDRCPGCEKGRVDVQQDPRVLVRIAGQAPLTAAVYELERLRCNLCGEVFTAQTPEGMTRER